MEEYIINYSGFGFLFETKVEAETEEKAREFFEKYYTRATILSITQKQ